MGPPRGRQVKFDFSEPKSGSRIFLRVSGSYPKYPAPSSERRCLVSTDGQNYCFISRLMPLDGPRTRSFVPAPMTFIHVSAMHSGRDRVLASLCRRGQKATRQTLPQPWGQGRYCPHVSNPRDHRTCMSRPAASSRGPQAADACPILPSHSPCDCQLIQCTARNDHDHPRRGPSRRPSPFFVRRRPLWGAPQTQNVPSHFGRDPCPTLNKRCV